MSVYYLLLAVFILLMALVPYNSGQHYIDDEDQIEIIRSCESGYVHGSNCEQDGQLNIIITATMNGDITALDGNTGETLWRYKDAPLLQGTLATAGPIDVGGTSLQLMPTLDGRLFSYAHHINLIEPLSITTDSLLESTIRLGQDAVAGGKSVTTKGFDLFTGELKYECSMDSCGNRDSELPQNPIILVKRISNSIRAMDTLRGVERWNLSTAEIDVSLAGGINTLSVPANDLRVLLRPPDGVVVAVNKHNREEWKANVNGHIFSVWQISGNTISEVSIFDPINIYTTQNEVIHRERHKLQTQSSLLYMGTSDGSPFIIQSQKAKENLKKKMNSMPEISSSTSLTTPRSCSASGDSNSLAYDIQDETLRVVLHNAFQKSHGKAIEDKSSGTSAQRSKLQIMTPATDRAQTVGTENLRSTSLTKDGDYGYLVLETETRRNKFKVPSPINFVHNLMSYVVNPSTVISFFTGVLGVVAAVVYSKMRRSSPKMINQFPFRESTDSESISQRTRTTSYAPADDEIERFVEEGSDMSGSPLCTPIRKVEILPIEHSNKELHTTSIVKPKKRLAKTDIDTDDESFTDDEKQRLRRNRTISRSSLEGFTSRFANEFEVKKVIGHGGFGVVFRAQSITDMNEYAVKRIAVADNEKARNRVLREARALAMFDHPGIIRYFYAWEERPPKGYQEKEDESLLGKIKADKLAKLHEIKRRKHENCEKALNVKSADTASFGETFEMPPVVGNTNNTEDSWSATSKPRAVKEQRTTSESKKGLHGESESTTAEVLKEKSVRFSENDESDTSEDEDDDSSSSDISSSSSGSLVVSKKKTVYSSSGGIEFVNGSVEEVVDAQEELEAINEHISINNRAMIDETENQELEVRERNETGECAYLYIVMQLCAEKTLEDWIRRSKNPESRPLNIMKNWIKQLASGLHYLHEKGYIHRDLKPGNVFFSLDSKPDHHILKIGDLGLATKTDGAPKITSRQDSDSSAKHTRNVGTRSYMSPEQIGHQQYTEKVDIFALGLVATELIIPFATSSERIHTFTDFQKGEFPPILDNHKESRDFLLHLTSLDPSKRPTASEVASHPFLQ